MSGNQINETQKGNKIHLKGYTSTSKLFEVAGSFAIRDLKEGQVPVVYAIEFHGREGLFELSAGYTAFPNEDEVLIQDGL